MLQVSCTDSAAGCKWGREAGAGRLHGGTGGACKRARSGESGEVRGKSVGADAGAATHAKPASEDERRDPLDVLGLDVFQSHILTVLDSQSLARCAAVSPRWRPWALADKLWRPLVEAFLAQRAHLPRCLVGRDLRSAMSQHAAYAIAMADSQRRALAPADLCSRTWELRLKPPVGPYWLNLDPSQAGGRGLHRYLSCDGSVTADPDDPIWGGHESAWEFVRVKAPEGGAKEVVRINRWPPLFPRRAEDGRWVLENFYGLYATCPDNPAFSSGTSDAVLALRPSCSSCTAPTL